MKEKPAASSRRNAEYAATFITEQKVRKKVEDAVQRRKQRRYLNLEISGLAKEFVQKCRTMIRAAEKAGKFAVSVNCSERRHFFEGCFDLSSKYPLLDVVRVMSTSFPRFSKEIRTTLQKDDYSVAIEEKNEDYESDGMPMRRVLTYLVIKW